MKPGCDWCAELGRWCAMHHPFESRPQGSRRTRLAIVCALLGVGHVEEPPPPLRPIAQIPPRHAMSGPRFVIVDDLPSWRDVEARPLTLDQVTCGAWPPLMRRLRMSESTPALPVGAYASIERPQPQSSPGIIEFQKHRHARTGAGPVWIAWHAIARVEEHYDPGNAFVYVLGDPDPIAVAETAARVLELRESARRAELGG